MKIACGDGVFATKLGLSCSGGEMKQMIADQVEGMETTLAHLFPELTANIAGPLLMIAALFVFDWRMALISLITIPMGFSFTISVMGTYSRAAFVSQDNFLFNESVRENIRMGRMSATDDEAKEVCRAAGCDTFIRGPGNGYDTKVGGGGAHLSGGEQQRIAIARAILKDAPIVILDEATAYIAPENEAVLPKAIAKPVKGKTVIVIAHRLSTIKDADKIVVVRDGKIEAQGRHESLLADCPLYGAIWQAHIGAKET